MKLWMSPTVCIILINAALALPIKLTGAAIAHFSVNTFEEPFLLGWGDKRHFLLCQWKGEAQDAWSSVQCKGKNTVNSFHNYRDFSVSFLCLYVWLWVSRLLSLEFYFWLCEMVNLMHNHKSKTFLCLPQRAEGKMTPVMCIQNSTLSTKLWMNEFR